ncbi:MAG: PAS domain S-box protein [Verrucomicrobiota bacterium]
MATYKNDRILIIDDNPSIHEDIRKILGHHRDTNKALDNTKALLFGDDLIEPEQTRFEIDSAYQGKEGLDKVQQATEAGRPYAMAFVDVRMPPGWDGIETISHIWKTHPDLQVVICSAYSDYSWTEMIRQIGKSDSLVILKKPFENIELLQLAHALTEKWQLNRQVKTRLSDLDQAVNQRTTELQAANAQLKKEIDERMQVEKVLLQSEATLKESQRIASMGSYVLDLASGHWSSSEMLDEVLGIAAAYEHSVDGWTALTHPADRARMDDYFKNEVLGQSQPFNKEYRIIRHHDQAERWVHGLGRLEFDAQGRPVKMIGTIQDITERKRVEEANARLATAVEQSAETIVITNPEGVILYANPAFEATSGYTRAEVLGQNPRFLKSGKQGAEFYREMWNTLKRGEVWQGHFINRHKDGTLYEEEATVSPVRDAVGKTINYVAVKRDVTREVQLEAQFRQSQKMQAIGQLAAGVAHDFNNILTVILGHSSLLLEVKPPGSSHRKPIEAIATSAERAAQLVRQLLTFSRKQFVKASPMQIGSTLSSISEMLRRVLPENIVLTINNPPGLPLINADAGMMEQMLMNLAVNARDAMPEGGRLTICVELVEISPTLACTNPDARPGRFLRLRVADTGCGMTPDVMSHIFEPFFTTKAVGKGTGLGLATVYGIVKQHEAWVEVQSQPGQGACFQIYIPACAVETKMEPVAVVPGTLHRGSETILVAEDETAVREFVVEVLRTHGYRVIAAESGPRALECWANQHGKIHLLLTDMMMPGGLTGRDLAKRLLMQDPTLKVIYSSGYSPGTVEQTFTTFRGKYFLPKPYCVDKLLRMLRECLDEASVH